MPEAKAGGAKSGFLAFWTSLPGVLTGVAAVVGAIATLAALFIDDAGTGSGVRDDSPASETKAVFKSESVVDELCETIEESSNTTQGGDKHVLQNYDTLRLALGGAYYDLRLGGDTTIWLTFRSVVP